MASGKAHLEKYWFLLMRPDKRQHVQFSREKTLCIYAVSYLVRRHRLGAVIGKWAFEYALYVANEPRTRLHNL